MLAKCIHVKAGRMVEHVFPSGDLIDTSQEAGVVLLLLLRLEGGLVGGLEGIERSHCCCILLTYSKKEQSHAEESQKCRRPTVFSSGGMKWLKTVYSTSFDMRLLSDAKRIAKIRHSSAT